MRFSVRFHAEHAKIVQNRETLFSLSCAQHVLAKSHDRQSSQNRHSVKCVLKIVKLAWPQILFKTGKQFALYENCTKRSFQVMRSMFWPNRIFDRQSS